MTVRLDESRACCACAAYRISLQHTTGDTHNQTLREFHQHLDDRHDDRTGAGQ